MICKDMKAIIKNVEHGDSNNKFVVAKPVDCLLWYYGRYETAEKAFDVAKKVGGIVVIDEYYDIFAQMNAIKQYIKLTEDTIAENPDDFKTYYAACETGFDCIRNVVKGE